MKIIPTITSLALLLTVTQATTIATWDFTLGSTAATSAYGTGTMNAGALTYARAAEGRWAVQTQNTETNLYTNYQNGAGLEFTYTVSGLASGEAIDITSASIDATASVNDTGGFRVDFNEVSTNTFVGNTVAGTFMDTVSYTGLTNGDSITLYFTVRDGLDDVTSHFFDNVILEGDVYTVPEPTSFGLLGLGSLMVISRRKR